MSIKQLALKYLPKPLQKAVRSQHYAHQLRDYPMQMEPDLFGCKSLLHPGDTFIDVGANIGVYTRFGSEFVGPSGEVHSLEPIPDTFAYLSHNIAELGLDNVTLYNFAASNKDDDGAAMSMPDFESGGANIYEARLSDSGDIPVRTRRLDTLFPALCPRLIKCDVEGHEIACIEGARELIARCKPHWVVEVSKAETFEIFSTLRYQAWVWTEGSFQPRAPEDKRPNYFFFHRDNPPER